MTTYVFAWNPRLWNWPELPRKRRSIQAHGHVDIRWACGRTRSIEPGSRAFFVRLGVPPKGLIASGHALSEPWEAQHWLAEKAALGATTHYLKLRLEGSGKANRAAIGARAIVRVGGKTFTRQVEAGTGSGCQNDLTLHFGLGGEKGPAEVTVHWPAGGTSTHRVEVDRTVALRKE